MSIWLKRVLLIIAALGFAVLCAFAADRIAYTHGGYYETEFDGSPIFTDGSEAFGISGCEINNNHIIITGGDPQFALLANDSEISIIRVVFSEPLAQDTDLQIYYALPDGAFSESDSITTTISSQSTEKLITIPKAIYSIFRFDFDQDVSLDGIYTGNNVQVYYRYHLKAIYLIILALAVFFSLCGLGYIIHKSKKANTQEVKKSRPFLTIILCNLLLSLTVGFYQPLDHILVNLKDYLLPFENIWWVQLLFSIGLAAILSLLMFILPPKAGRIAASISLGIGLAFLIQALLLNGGRPIEMNTTWPMEVLNIFVWFGIVCITVSTVVHFIKEQEKRTDTAMNIIALVLIILQMMNFTILTGAAEAPIQLNTSNTSAVYHEASIDNELAWENLEGNLLTISMARGTPFQLKGYFTYNTETVNTTLFKTKAQSEEAPVPAEPVDDCWELTQYPDLTGNVGLFYSLYHPYSGKLILVDSGNPQNAEQVRSVIDHHGGHVDAWFLTHYHGDHIGAFNALWEEYKDKIDVIYVNPLDWDTFESIYRSYDTPEAFSGFLEETKDATNVVTLYSGDELEIDGLKIKVFSSFDEHVREMSTDWPNDSSIVFKVSAKEESVLFMGDLSRMAVPLGQYIIDTYGADEVRADYIQAGHHGNWGQPISFYEQLMPKVIFQDGPEWLITGEQYDAKDLATWCAENGITTYDYRQAPTMVYLH